MYVEFEHIVTCLQCLRGNMSFEERQWMTACLEALGCIVGWVYLQCVCAFLRQKHDWCKWLQVKCVLHFPLFVASLQPVDADDCEQSLSELLGAFFLDIWIGIVYSIGRFEQTAVWTYINADLFVAGLDRDHILVQNECWFICCRFRSRPYSCTEWMLIYLLQV